MTIEGVTSYAEIYSENLTDEDIKTFDNLGVEWRGRNLFDIRDDLCIKAVTVFARLYAQKALSNPDELPQLKAEIVEVFEDLFDTELEDEDEPSPLLYRFDPISGTYRELIGAEGKFIKKTGKKVGKSFKKAKKAVTKGVRESGRWVREHPVETAVIAAAVVVVIATAGAAAGPIAGTDAIAGSVGGAAAAGAAAAASNNGSNSKRKKDSDDEPPSSSLPNPPSSQGTSQASNSITISPPQPVNTTSTYTPNISQGFSTSNPLPQDPFPHKAFSNPSYEPSDVGSRNPASLVMPTSLTHEPKTYSAPASIKDILKSSSYASSKETSLLMNYPPNSSQSIEHYKHGEFSLPQQVRINPNGSLAYPFPGYQEMQTSPLSSTPPKVTSVTNQTKEEPWTDFVKGVSKGFPRGCVDSVKEIPSTFSTIVKVAGNYVLAPFIHPLNHLPGQETVSQALAVYETIEYLRTCDDGEVSKATGELIKAVAPEAHKLFTDWDKLSIEERGDLSAYCAGKYGTDFLLPIAAAKGVKVVGGVLKEASVLGKLKSTIAADALETRLIGAAQGSSKASNTVQATESLIAKETTLAPPQIIATESTSVESVLVKTVEKPSFRGIKVQPNGIWEIEGKNIKSFDKSIIFKQEGKADHLFKAEHELSKIGPSQDIILEKITDAVVKADRAGQIPLNQPFEILLPIDGLEVRVHGIVLNGELKYGTFFVPNN